MIQYYVRVYLFVNGNVWSLPNLEILVPLNLGGGPNEILVMLLNGNADPPQILVLLYFEGD